ncbi:unnamed protein product [Malus baccata var. baccata]
MEREEDDSESELLIDRFRLSTIHIAEAEPKRNAMGISVPVMACIADLAFKYTGTGLLGAEMNFDANECRLRGPKQFQLDSLVGEQLAKDLELFSQHGGRKTANMEDVILSAHRNEHLAALLRSFCNDLKAKEPQSERNRKKSSKREDQATTSVVHIPDS